jgi:hypothetical protein
MIRAFGAHCQIQTCSAQRAVNNRLVLRHQRARLSGARDPFRDIAGMLDEKFGDRAKRAVR